LGRFEKPHKICVIFREVKKTHKKYRTKNIAQKIEMLLFDQKKYAQKKAHKKWRTKNRPC